MIWLLFIIIYIWFDLITAEQYSLETVHIKFKTAYQIKMTKITGNTEAVN